MAAGEEVGVVGEAVGAQSLVVDVGLQVHAAQRVALLQL